MSDKLHEHIASLMRAGGGGGSGSRGGRGGGRAAAPGRASGTSGAQKQTNSNPVKKAPMFQYNQSKGEDELGITYSQLDPEIHAKALPKFSGDETPLETVDKFITNAIVSTLGTTGLEATRVATNKLTNQWLVLEPTPTITAQAKAKQRQRQRIRSRNGRAVAKTKRENGLIIPSGKTAAGMEYAKLEFLRKLWLAYADDLLQGCTTGEMAAVRLVRADFHGATIKVVQTKTPPALGIEGTVVQETAAVFKVVTRENVCKTVPKAESIFEVMTPKFKVILFGKNICQKPSERSKKKNKVKYTIEIL